MRYLTSGLFMLLLMTPLSFVSAHASSGNSMMGSDSWDTNMMQFEDTLVEDDELHEQMEQYVQAMLDGELTDEQETQMLEWMFSDEYQPAMMSIMMRSIIDDDENEGDVHDEMMGSWGYGGIMSFGWITMILVWAFLILGIAAFWKTLSSKNK